MIVRCKSCNSAFAVDDEKVSGKKFAYSCLKCGTENIVDNRADDLSLEADAFPISDAESDNRPGTDVDTFSDNSSDTPAAPEDDIFFDEDIFDSPEPDTSQSDKKTIADDESGLFTDEEIISFEDDADEKSIKPESEDDLIFDDFETSDISIEETDIDVSDSPSRGKEEPKLTRQEDIDELFASIPSSEKTSSSSDDKTILRV